MKKLYHALRLAVLLSLPALPGCEIGTDPVPIATVQMAAPSQSVIVTRDLQLSARAFAADGTELTTQAFSWSSDDSNIASVSSTGLVRGNTPGPVIIRAEVGGKSGHLTITVIRAPVTQVTVEPVTPSVTAGSSVQLVARIRDENGGFPTDRVITWSSSTPAVASVSTSGLASGWTVGSTTITATAEGVQGQVTLTVSPPPFALALSDGRVRIHPSVVDGSSFLSGQPLWLAWMGNEFLQRHQNEEPYKPVSPNSINRLQRVDSGEYTGWYETAVPVVGTCFTVVQFDGSTRRWANLARWNGRPGIYGYQGQTVMKLSNDGHAAERLNSLIRVSHEGDHRYVFLARALLPTESLALPWKLVGTTNDWYYETGRAINSTDATGFTFDVSGLRRYANVRTRSTAATDVWGLFNVLADGSIDLTDAGCAVQGTGYRHPNLFTDGQSTGIWLEPAEMPEHLPHLFVNGLEGRVGWPNPSQPPHAVVGTFRAATPWLTMVDDTRAPEPSWVEIDYLKLWALGGGNTVLVAENSYSDGRLGGTLASRDDWFKYRWDELQQHASISNGVVRLPLSDVPNRAWHVWVEDSWPTTAGPNWRHLLPENTQEVWVEAKIRIRGPAALQLGWDYYRSTDDVKCDIDLDKEEDDGWCEAGKTRWIFESFDDDGWQVITLRR